MSQPTLPRLLLLLLLLLLHLLIIPSAISARPLTQHKSTPSSLKDESPISIDGLCGSHSNNNQKTTCLHSPFGDSCSKWGFCGSFYEKEYSGIGCQVDFGVCNSEFATLTDDAAESSTTSLSTSSSFSTSTTTSTPGIIIIPATTTFVSVVVSTSVSGSFTPVQTLTGMVGFCGVAGSNCAV
ncbi:uncharacterized protein SEPMUDRAFT_105298 [Sphaerulina musiva SO2202]|uniref:Uncharacterized protein n=1 Tax=Sphaerulina musiva (strain SO2202) TaxID=692275 RepID=M3C409_SPHMS|nr:uncharacterized protein SEPMUDRAFT_105298 [Sphaerulina musiva SO2202]EMF14981.1 hypothetical protein SEPMUDRAFT_105298 [Sphaerulina musiva SO2202]